MDDKGEEKMGKAANSSISLKQIHVTDNFWNKYVHLVKDVIIPYPVSYTHLTLPTTPYV